MLLDDLEDVVEVFCEHHEDVLVKHKDGQFTGQQIKTRESSQPPWKAGDEAVRDTCVRFTKLESNFPGRFRRFLFLTNHPLHIRGNGQDFPFVLTQIRSAEVASEVPSPAISFLRRVAKEAECAETTVHKALSKTGACDRLPKLDDIAMRLLSDLTTVWTQAQDCTAAALMSAAERLIWECGRASSLAHRDLLPGYLPMSTQPQTAEVAATIDGKRITKTRLLSVLEQGLNQAASLHGALSEIPMPGAGSPDLLLKKLDAGGFSVVSRNSALDLRDKADYLALVWTQKFGRNIGLQRYDHVRSLVLAAAASAFEATQSHEAFGLRMLADLRNRIQKRREGGGALYDCTDEHLEGVAYSLTSQCKVQWSRDRPWERK